MPPLHTPTPWSLIIGWYVWPGITVVHNIYLRHADSIHLITTSTNFMSVLFWTDNGANVCSSREKSEIYIYKFI